jgi:excinuclease ABC subunit B
MRSIMDDLSGKDDMAQPLVAEEEVRYGDSGQLKRKIAKLKKEMLAAAADLEF